MPIKTGAKIDTLSSLNTMASYLGIPPLLALSDLTTEPDFVLAQEILDETTTSVLSIGLPCNTDHLFPLTEVEALTGFVIVPDGALLCDVDDNNYVERDGLIYNRDLREFTTQINLTATLVFLQEYDPLPEIVKKYIEILASRTLVARIKGDAALLQLTIPDERRVKNDFQRYTFDMGDYNMLRPFNEAYISDRSTRVFHTF